MKREKLNYALLIRGERSAIPPEMAKEMADVGIVPTEDAEPVGTKFESGGVWYVWGELATREEFFEAFKKTGRSATIFARLPDTAKFQRLEALASGHVN